MATIKICGITNLEDALVAVDAGADALGFNFYRRSPRYVEPMIVRKIVRQLPESVLTVGVFVNETEIESVATMAGVAALQLHGDESPAACAELNDWYVIKAISVRDDFDVTGIRAYDVNAIMLDAAHKTLRGGTGEVFDWSIAKTVNALGVRLYLAGGLSPDNVAEAITAVRPYAVDACSGIEREPGRKDHEKVRKFVQAARSV